MPEEEDAWWHLPKILVEFLRLSRLPGAGPKDKNRINGSKETVIKYVKTTAQFVPVLYITIYKSEVGRDSMLSDEERLTVVNVVASYQGSGGT